MADRPASLAIAANAYVVQEAGTQADTSRGLFRQAQTGGSPHLRGAAWVKLY